MSTKRKASSLDSFVTVTTKKSNNGNPIVNNNNQDGRFTWKVMNKTLIKARYTPKEEISEPEPAKGMKIAAFDLDSTLVKTKTRSPFPRNGDDWRWAFPSVIPVLRKLAGIQQDDDKSSEQRENTALDTGSYIIAIISNQGGTIARPDTRRYQYLYQRLEAIGRELNIPIRFYAATKVSKGIKDEFRKPETRMWQELVKDVTETDENSDKQKEDITIDMENSFFVGDALGRKTDFSDSDKMFAQNVGVKCYSPEEFFQQ